MLKELGARIGLAGGTGITAIAGARADVAWASEAGFHTYWLSQVFGVDPVVALAAVADAGPALAELGTSVVPTVGRHPIALAQQARTAQQAAGDRFTLGVGPSHEIVAEAVFGETWDRPRRRTEEYLDALLPLCRGEAAAVSSPHMHAHATLDIPCAPVPVILAALGPRMLALAGRATAGTHLGNCGPKTIRNHVAPVIREAAAAAGRPEPRIIALVAVSVTDDPAASIEASRVAGAGYAALPSYRRTLDLEGVESPADLLLAGSYEHVHEGLAAYVEAGATDLRIGAAGPDAATVARTRDALATALA